MRAKHVMLAAAIALLTPTAHGEAQEIGQPGRGFVLAQRLCAECHAIQKEYSRSANANAPRFQAIASIPGMTAIGRAQSQHHAARRPAGRHHRLYSEPQMSCVRLRSAMAADAWRAGMLRGAARLSCLISSPNRWHQWQTRTGIFVCVSTLVVTLPSTIAAIPLLPCEAMTMRSQPLCLAASMMAS